MDEEVKKEKVIEDWAIDRIEVGEPPDNFMAPVLKGFVEGQRIRTGIIYWLDTKEKVAMTKKSIFKLGKPDGQWYNIVVANGFKLEDMNITDTVN